MRCEKFEDNEHYILTGAGVNGNHLFLDDHDKARFIFLITHFQSPIQIYNVSWYTQALVKKGSFRDKESRIKQILKSRNVELLAFVLLSDSFHLLVKNLSVGILSVYMHRVLTAYSKYYNSKYGRRGHVFDGPFRANLIKSGAELRNASAYLHQMPRDVFGQESTWHQYPFSSYQDYIGLNRWGEFLCPNAILSKFKNQADYKRFVETSGLDKPQKQVLK